MANWRERVEHMQRSLIDTVTQVREGSDAIYSGTSEIAAGNTDLSSVPNSRPPLWEETAASMEQLTATVKQNADNAVRLPNWRKAPPRPRVMAAKWSTA
ncbi:methyl accepting chemotaxis protein II, aspartate sensor-receptor [Salmonella enterica subsp. enterica]|uniref:Methyl accepting chemotaxis protein II, aspartate sensor-receptor n=1 Tax=Salmonella enterica I TaxID=59201 RepID=A0A447P9F4_SALET|nr:methyl accepting chemotaxis protein II, aspartate sensor-receptor [Salmonella enterica subsp. enterica]